MKDFLLVLVGGICSVVGGCVAIWYQAKKARSIRLEEIKGEQQLEVYKKALSLTDQVQSLWIQGTPNDVLNLLYNNGEWFSVNQILLPHTFVVNWRSIRLSLRKLIRRDQQRQQMPEGPNLDKLINECEKILDFIQKLIDEMEKELRSELNLPEVKIKKPSLQVNNTRQ
jgi:hypothetical protein